MDLAATDLIMLMMLPVLVVPFGVVALVLWLVQRSRDAHRPAPTTGTGHPRS